jgi:hypothetical protein
MVPTQKKRIYPGARSSPSVLLVALVSALGLTACGGGSEEGRTSENVAASASGLKSVGSDEGYCARACTRYADHQWWVIQQHRLCV